MSCLLLWWLPPCAEAVPGGGQVGVEAWPLQRKQLHERCLRLLRGGDGRAYVVMGSSGHYWSFGAEGERGLKVYRLGAGGEVESTLRTQRWGRGRLRLVLEVMPAPDGIALLSVLRDSSSGMQSLQICRPDWSTSPPGLQWTKLADMPQLVPGVHQPCLRVHYTADSSSMLITWRRLGDDRYSDRSLAGLVLDRSLKVVRPLFFPFKHMDDDILMRDVLLLDDEEMVFTVQRMGEGNLTGPGTIGYGIMHYDILQGNLRTIHLGVRREAPIETRLALGPDGRVAVSGWYLPLMDNEHPNVDVPQPEAESSGVFIGYLGTGDTLEDVGRHLFADAERSLIIERARRNGALGIRPSFHSTLLPNENGWSVVLHYRGEMPAGLQLQSPLGRANNCLLVWEFDKLLRMKGSRHYGFHNWGREEIHESFSWRPLYLNGQWWAFFTDASNVRNDAHPVEARGFLVDLHSGERRDVTLKGEKGGQTLLAPREMVRVSAEKWWVMGIAGRRWRVLELIGN